MKRCFLFGVVYLLAGVSFASSTNKTVVGSIEDLEALLKETQETFLPISPPSESVFIQSDDLVIPVDWSGFPKAFTQQMYPVMDFGFPVYTVVVYEDPVTRDSVFMNVYGTEVYRLSPLVGYDPYEYLNSQFGEDGSRQIDSLNRWIFDPAHTAVDLTLIPEVFEQDYNAAQEAAKAAASPMMMSLPSSMMVMSSSSSSYSAPWLDLDINTNDLVDLTVNWPSGFTNDLEIFATSDLTEWWNVIKTGIGTTGATSYTWTDSSSSNTKHRVYRIENADLDFDDDGLSDALEILTYDSDPTDDDSDSDGIDDVDEVTASISTDPSNSDIVAPTVTIASPVNNIVIIP